MRLIGLAVVLALSLVFAPLAGEAQQAKIPVVGFLAERATSDLPFLEGLHTEHLREFQHELERLGYVQGRNVFVNVRVAYPLSGLLEKMADDLVNQNPAVIVTVGTRATLAAQGATTTIPIVMIGVADPIGSGFARSLPRPGGMVTGLSFLGPEVIAKGLELLLDAVPNASKVAVLLNPENPATVSALRLLEETAGQLKLTLTRVEMRGRDQLGLVFHTIASQRPSGLIVINDARFFALRHQLVALATLNQLPTVFQLRDYVEVGDLMAYGPRVAIMYGALLSLCRRS